MIHRWGSRAWPCDRPADETKRRADVHYFFRPGRCVLPHRFLTLNVSQTGRRIGAHVGEDHPLLVIVFAQNPVLRQVEAIAHAKSLVALLAGETVEVVDVALGPHHHLEGRNDFAARGAVASRSE